MSALAKVQEQPAGEVIQADATTLMAVISRAASDPNIDVDKLERLLGMHERITARQTAAAFDDAMNAAQEAMRPIAADANNPQTRSRYASYAALDRALRPIYTGHGFSLAFDTADCPKEDHLRVVCRVKRAGHTEIHHLDMPADGKGAKGGDVMTKTHATGAAITYGKRYLLGMVFNIAVGEDIDGNQGRGDASPISAEQVRTLNAFIDGSGADRAAFLKYLGVAELAELPASKFQAALNALQAKKRQPQGAR